MRPSTADVVGEPPAVARAVRQVQADAGREAGFRVLYETYHRPVCRLFLRRGFPPAEAEELTQDTFMRVHRYMPDYDHRGQFAAWLFSVADSVAKKAWRRGRAQKRDGVEAPYDESGARDDDDPLARVRRPPGRSASQARDAYDRERREILGGAVAELPERQRQCLALHLRGHTYREIGTVLQIAAETVKRHLAEARRTLRVRLADLDLGPLENGV